MTKYDVSGMSCAACSARVEKAVKGVAGVSACNVSLLTNSMTVEGDVDPSSVIAAVNGAGYNASLAGQKANKEQVPDSETPRLVKRLVFFGGFACYSYVRVNVPHDVGRAASVFTFG